MSDVRLRRLERSWNETGTVTDEASFLLERVRVGDLKQHRLELAAHLGHAASMKVLGLAPQGDQEEPFCREKFGEWINEFLKFPDCQTSIFRALVAGLRVVIPGLADNLRHEPQVAETLVAIERWVLNPTESVRAIDLSGFRAAAGDLYMDRHISSEVVCPERQSYRALAAISDALHVVRSLSVFGKDCSDDFRFFRKLSEVELTHLLQVSPSEPSDLPEDARVAGAVLTRARNIFNSCTVAARDVPHMDQGGAALVRDAISTELIPWVLGRTDPLQTRVTAREVARVREDFRGGITQLFGV